MSLIRTIKSTEVKVLTWLYAYYSVGPDATIPPGNHFALIRTSYETTIITKVGEQGEKWWSQAGTFVLLEITMLEPSFYAVWFLSFITSTIAQAWANVCVVCWFSKDYLLIFENELEKTLKALKDKWMRIAHDY